jgi:hypothetical protein
VTSTSGRTPRGPEAIEALIEEFELRDRLDEPDAPFRRSVDMDLRWAHGRIGAAQRAAAADIVTYEEAMEWLASTVGRELPSTLDDEEYER